MAGNIKNVDIAEVDIEVAEVATHVETTEATKVVTEVTTEEVLTVIKRKTMVTLLINNLKRKRSRSLKMKLRMRSTKMMKSN